MNRNPSPKSEFLTMQSAVRAHHELIEQPALKVGLDTALAEMQRRAAAGTDSANFNLCAASHLRLLGAQDFVEIFLNLAETAPAVSRTDTTNLPGNVTSLASKKG